MNYSIVVVTWQSADHLRSLVASMNLHLSSTPELIVVDNDSEDDPEAAANEWRGRTVFVRLPENRGFGSAANEGVARAAGAACVILNPDTRLPDGSLDRLADAAVQLNAIVGPRVLNPDGSVQPSASGPPAGLWPWIGALVPGALAPPPIRERTEPWRLDRRVRVGWLTGCCVAAPTRLLRELGPFDPTIHLYSEDLDLGIRAGRAGIPSWFCPQDAAIIHFADGSSSRRFSDRGLHLAVSNRLRVLERAFGMAAATRAWKARKLNLLLRVITKGALRMATDNEAAELIAMRHSAEAHSARNSRVPSSSSGSSRGDELG